MKKAFQTDTEAEECHELQPLINELLLNKKKSRCKAKRKDFT